MNKEKVKEFIKDNKDSIEAYLLGFAVAGVSYALGYNACKKQYDMDLGILCVVSPELKAEMEDTIELIRSRAR